MAFTVTVTERPELDPENGRACDGCSTNSAGVPAPQAAQDQVDNAVTVQLSPLEN